MTPALFTVPNFPPTTDVYGVDLESSYATGRDIKSLGVWPYLRHPDTQIYLVSIYGPGVSYSGPLETAPWAAISGKHWVSHNAGFDYAAYVVACERGQIPDGVYPCEWDCTANLAAFCGANRSLAGAVAAIFDVKLSKVTRDEMKGQRWETMTPEFQAECIRYALDDAKWCWELWDSCAHNWPAQEVAASRHTLLMCSRGVAIDLAYVADAEAKLKHALWETEGKIPWAGELDLKGKEIKITSTKALKDECVKIGIPAPLSTADKNEIFDKWLAEYEDKAPFVAAVKAHRSINRTLDVVGKFRDRTQADGRMPYELKYFGGHTGRWSGGGGLNCVTGDHEVLTPSGWVRIDAWDGQKIAQWSTDESIQFVDAHKVVQPYSGPLIEVESAAISLLATPDHRVVFRAYRGKVKVLPASRFLAGPLAGIPTAGHFDGESHRTPEQVRLLAALAADGTSISKRGKLNRSLSWGFNKARKVLRLRGLLQLAGITYTETPPTDGKTTHFYVRGVDAPYWLTKGFGPWILDLSKPCLEAFCEEVTHWDGFANRLGRRCQFSSTLRDQADWVQTACHLAGRNASLRSYPSVAASGEVLNVYQKQESHKAIANGRGRTTVRQVPYTGMVYCPQTPSSFWLVRRNGKIHVTGNCQNITKKPVAGVDLRGCIYPTPGKKFIVADLSQIEARVALWYAEDWAQLELLRNGMDVYEAHARATMGYNQPGSLKEYCAELPLNHKDKKMRDIAKARVLGLGFGMGHVRLIDFAKTLIGIDLSVAEAKQIVNGFRNANKGIVKMWDSLHSAMENHAMKHRPKAVANFTGAAAAVLEPTPPFSIDLPSWRSLDYYDVSQADGLKAKDERGGLATHWFGGKLYENLVQATARDILVEAILRIEEAGYPVVLHVHDEVICEVPLDTDPEVIRAMMTVTPEWAPGLPIGSSSENAERYFK